MNESLLLLVLLAALVAVPLVLRRFRASAPDAVRVVGRTAVHKGAVVAVIAVGDRRLLVGTGERGVQLLAELDANEPASGHQDLCTTSTLAGDHPLASIAAARTDAGARGDADLAGVLSDPPAASATHDHVGPGIGLVDRLRAMTVRTPVRGRPIDVLRR